MYSRPSDVRRLATVRLDLTRLLPTHPVHLVTGPSDTFVFMTLAFHATDHKFYTYLP